MNTKKFMLSHYNNSTEEFHIHKVENSAEAQKPHTHEYFQIYFILKGSLEHHLQDEWAHLSQGDMFIIPPGTIHYISPKPNTVFYSFSFMENFLFGQNTSNRLARNFLRSLQADENKNIKPKISIVSEEILYVENIMSHILKEFTQKPLGYIDTIQAYTLLLVTMLARSYFESSGYNASNHFENNKQFVLHCVEYIESNFTENILLDEITRKSAMSKGNFCTLFLKLTGKTFNTYLNSCRIKKATEYIRQGYKITGIYGLCGYNDFSTFNRNFKKLMGISPRDYQKNIDK